MTTDSTRVLHFQDDRPPHEVKFALERELRVLFKTSMECDKLCMRAKATVVGAAYEFWLRFDAALPTCNGYSLTMDVSWADQASCNADYYRKTSASWFEFWTRDFLAASPPLAGEGSVQRYRQMCEEAFSAEQDLDSIAAVQGAIITAMKRGASFRTSHKEGGTNIYWKSNRFVRSDYGDYPDEKQFNEETEFLKMLRQFCHLDVTRNSGKEQLSEIDAWRLIMRQIHLP
jgi:hypothetical protein